jgi:hypothetical protein
MLKFLSWPELAMLPCNRISAYMYAALARKLASGQKRYPTRGIVNDITMLAAYMPYVRAMFVDKECASLLREAPLSKDLTYKARIFSLKTGDAFLTYIEELIENAPEEVLQAAKEVYGGP